MADESWFAFRTVAATSGPPCVNNTVPSIDSTGCYELGERLLGPSGIVQAEASGFELPGDCDQSEVGELCISTEPPDATSQQARTVWSVALTLSPEGLGAFNAAARQCFQRALDCPSGQIAIVIDGAVVSAPVIQQPGFEADQFQISGDFTEAEARALAARLT
jgi:hypothetical protein